MRVVVSSYTFIPASSQIVFTGYTNISQQNILLVLDATQQTILYNPTITGYGGTVSGNTLTLSQSTASGYSSTDVLQIFYEDLTLSTSVTQVGFLEKVIKKLSYFSWSASASGPSLNSNITNVPAVTVNSGTVTTVSSVTNVAAGTISSTIGNVFSQAGQSQAESQLYYQSTFRRNVTPV